eukprot:26795_1
MKPCSKGPPSASAAIITVIVFAGRLSRLVGSKARLLTFTAGQRLVRAIRGVTMLGG